MRGLATPKKIVAAVFIVVMCIYLSSCVYLVVGGVAAVGGYVVSPDTIQGETERSFDDVWDAALEIVTIMGSVDSQSSKLGEITGIVNNTKVNLEIIQLTPSLVRIKVKSRKAFFPSIATAQEIYLKIMRSLDEEV